MFAASHLYPERDGISSSDKAGMGGLRHKARHKKIQVGGCLLLGFLPPFSRAPARHFTSCLVGVGGWFCTTQVRVDSKRFLDARECSLESCCAVRTRRRSERST